VSLPPRRGFRPSLLTVAVLAALLSLLAGCRHDALLYESLERPEPAPQAGAGFRFRDVAAAVGDRFHHVNGAAGELNLPETMGSGCAFLDFDGDGWPDIFFVNSRVLRAAAPQPGCALCRNNRDGTFSDVTAGSGLEAPFFGMGCAVGDYDNDGRDDIYVTACLDGSRLFHNLGGGHFEEVAEQAGVRNANRWGASAAWLNYDRDGKLDLFVSNYVAYAWGDNPRCATPELHRTYCNPHSFAPETCRLYRNLGGGRFRDVSAEAGITSASGKALGVLVFDYDEDGWPDVMVACDTTRNLLFHNRKGRFREEGVGVGLAFGENGSPRAGMGIDAAYPWNDGRLAVLVSNFSNEGLSFFTQADPGGAFLDSAGSAGVLAASRLMLGFGLAFLDVDNDGLRDAVAVNGHVDPWIGAQTAVSYAERHLLFRNLGGGRFTEVGPAAGFRKAWVSRGLAVGDYDRDGRPDLVISNNGQEAELLHNDSPAAGHWLEAQLEGVRSNRDGIGAEVRVTAGRVAQRDWVRSGSSYCSQSALPLHFGLGQATTAETLEVRWTSGRLDRYRAIPADRRIRIREGAPVPAVP